MKIAVILSILAVILASACVQQGGSGANQASITLISPTGGATFNGGTNLTITYSSTGVDNYQIWFTNNPNFACNSAGWTLIKNHPYAATSFDYTLPIQNTNTARVRVEGLSSNYTSLGFACSDFFTIKA